MNTQEYKNLKGLKKQNLSDNMSTAEIAEILVDGEIEIIEIIKVIYMNI